jgi:hypothetical protein
VIKIWGLIECCPAIPLLCSSGNEVSESVWRINELCNKPQVLSVNSAELACVLLEYTCIELVKTSVHMSLHTIKMCVFQPEQWSCKQRAVRFTTLILDSPHPTVLALPCQPPCLHVETSGWPRDVTGMLLGFGQSRASGCTGFRITRSGVPVRAAISVVVYEICECMIFSCGSFGRHADMLLKCWLAILFESVNSKWRNAHIVFCKVPSSSFSEEGTSRWTPNVPCIGA